MAPTTPNGTRTWSMRRPFGRVRPRSVSPIGSVRPMTSSTAAASDARRTFVERSRSSSPAAMPDSRPASRSRSFAATMLGRTGSQQRGDLIERRVLLGRRRRARRYDACLAAASRSSSTLMSRSVCSMESSLTATLRRADRAMSTGVRMRESEPLLDRRGRARRSTPCVATSSSTVVSSRRLRSSQAARDPAWRAGVEPGADLAPARASATSVVAVMSTAVPDCGGDAARRTTLVPAPPVPTPAAPTRRARRPARSSPKGTCVDALGTRRGAAVACTARRRRRAARAGRRR